MNVSQAQSDGKHKRIFAAAAALLLFCATGRAETVAPVVTNEVVPFALPQVRLLDGPFRHAMELDRDYILSLDTNRLLYSFRVNSGLPAPGKPYGGWMTPGHHSSAEFVGHYLSACALMYASTGDERLRERGNAVVAGFGQCQDKLGTGYIHTKPDRFTEFGEAPLGLWYQIHKILAGLMEMYVNCNNQQALEIARKLADWAEVGCDRMSDDRMQQMLKVEHGGMNEALANLYALTGEKKYLRLALRFNHQEVIEPASREVDNLTGKHANTQIPKFIGAAREFELTGDQPLRTAALCFWQEVTRERSYVIGGDSIGEYFSPKERLSQALGPNTCETCNTYNMLKLTRHLFCWEPHAEYADYYERALYNHILASQNPDTGMMVYFLPLAGGAKKYCTPEDSFWCCTGTGIENHAKYGDSIYFHADQEDLFVNLFVASELRWPEAGLTVRQETDFPREGSSKLTFTCEKPVTLQLNIRHPYWAESGFEIKVNGVRQQEESRPGSYASLKRAWHNGDTVEISMPFSLRTEGFRDNPHRVAFMWGPLVLCAETRAHGLNEPPYPVLDGPEGHWADGLKPVAGEAGNFVASPEVFHADEGSTAPVNLMPLYLEHSDKPYIVYWNAMTPEEWRTREAEARASAAQIVDRVIPNDPASESEHHVAGERTATGEDGWRHAVDGGWFSWEMRVLPDQAQSLRVKYWGSDNGGREFDIMIDGKTVATEKLENNRPGELYEETYLIPGRITVGKEKVTVRFQAHPGKIAGGVFGCAISR